MLTDPVLAESSTQSRRRLSKEIVVKPSSPRRVRFVALALIDETGERWDFDTSLGHSSDIGRVLGRANVDRILAARYRDVADVSAAQAMEIAAAEPATAGIYRRDGREIAVVTVDH